jgi:acyl-CoA synthetase (AMP-forming)/AMP-acid ligase II
MKVVGLVPPAPGHMLDREKLARWASEPLAPYKWPSEIIIKADLPIGPTGKVFKTPLKQLAQIS